MNSLIESVNGWAESAARLGWPMLWQSSLLIGLVLALDLLLRRKLRAAVRYALWLVVLVKLLLPPSLAFPTGAGWWLRPAKTAPPPRPPAQTVVTYDARSLPVVPLPATPLHVAPLPPALSATGWAFAGAVAVSAALFLWMLRRWSQVARDAARAQAAPAVLDRLLPELPLAGRVKLVDRLQSPAVCGLFRPVILLPRALAERLPPAQLRAVLLHEVIHLRRGDVWVNCLQTLLQIVYWWHPLLWVANARIRRVREEAVDDAVMLALSEEAESYAPTLLEVAKLALPRPLATLGLVGILESHSSLRRRIERLLEFRPPRRAGLGFTSVLGVLSFAALAVPMGDAPAPTTGAGATSSPTMPADGSQLYIRIFRISTNTLIEALSLAKGPVGTDELGSVVSALIAHFAKAGVDLDPATSPGKSAHYNYGNGLLLVRATLQDLDIIEGQIDKWNRASSAPKATPSHKSAASYTNVSQGRSAIISKLDHMRLDRVSFQELPLSEVVRFLADECKKRDPERRGINFLLHQDTNAATAATAAVLGPDGNLLAAPPPGQVDLRAIVIKIDPPLTDVRLGDALDAIVKVADHPIKYSIEDSAIVFSLRARETTTLYVRTFKVDPKTLLDSLHLPLTDRGNNPFGPIGANEKQRLQTQDAALRDYFTRLGADMDPARNPGKAAYFNERQGLLIVRATLADLDIIEAALQVLNTVPAQINVKARFVLVSEEDAKAVGLDWHLNTVLATNAASAGLRMLPSQLAATNGAGQALHLTGILTEPQFRAMLKALEQRHGTELLAQPEVTTLSGRQAQCKVAELRTIVRGINERALQPPGISGTNDTDNAAFKTEQMEFGPVLDITPTVLPDDYTINLSVLPSLTEFVGYEASQTNRVTVYLNGKARQVTPPQPVFRVCQIQSSVNVWDGQTLVLGGLLSDQVGSVRDRAPVLGNLPGVEKLFRSESKSTQKRNLLGFITPTIVDPAGNRVHSANQAPR
ncbi:MAG TPA: M56 family metallopeptidase [Candidatus Paceibacterota bacterium]|nr:M56 family metallopeptidase [Verrucomicrobiota bacterium]HSA12819.1 M56 family metallopeptidase [Candidatus Paceibacterota bacterium]